MENTRKETPVVEEYKDRTQAEYDAGEQGHTTSYKSRIRTKDGRGLRIKPVVEISINDTEFVEAQELIRRIQWMENRRKENSSLFNEAETS